jgi:hypothetical protein
VALVGDDSELASAEFWLGQVHVLDYGLLEQGWPAGQALGDLLARHNVGLTYLNERMIRHLELARPRDAWAFLNGPLTGGWQCVAGGNDPGDRWRLYVRSASVAPERAD